MTYRWHLSCFSFRRFNWDIGRKRDLRTRSCCTVGKPGLILTRQLFDTVNYTPSQYTVVDQTLTRIYAFQDKKGFIYLLEVSLHIRSCSIAINKISF